MPVGAQSTDLTHCQALRRLAINASSLPFYPYTPFHIKVSLEVGRISHMQHCLKLLYTVTQICRDIKEICLINTSISILCFKSTHANFLEDRRRVSHKLSFLMDKSSCLTSLTIPTVTFNSSSFQTTAGGTFKLKEKYSSGHLESLKTT